MLSSYTPDQLNALLAQVGHAPQDPQPRGRHTTAASLAKKSGVVQAKPSIDKVNFKKFDEKYVYICASIYIY